MNKQLFVLIVKQSHYLTKEYLKRFSQYDYKAQYTIFFKLVYNVYKEKEEKQDQNVVTEKVTTKLRTFYNKVKSVIKTGFKRFNNIII